MEDIRTEQALNIPNLLTMLRIGLLPVIIWRFRLGDLRGTLVLYLLAMLTDLLDGMIARRFGQITALGKLLDPLADKLSLITLIGLFVLDGQISGWVLWFVLMKEILLVVGSAAVLTKGVVVYAMPVGKATTAVFAASMTARLLAFNRAANILMGAFLLLSVLSLLWYLAAGMEKLRSDPIYHIES